ncbi:MAG TPA: ECF transporter S component [Allosphingosinicella sp.]|nr:ECF transporter S component [Allosphingosinicella sp.]
MKKQAVVVIHGMGEQIPMETLTSFVDSVWTTDPDLVDRTNKPDPDTGIKPRSRNASWSRPDRRNRSFELRVITTESDKNGRRTDFYEYYWAHLIVDTNWAQVRAWIFELMLRDPRRDVPLGVLPVWFLLWLIAIGGGIVFLLTLRPTTAGVQGSWPGAIAVALGTAALGWLIGFLVGYFGDVARYVKAKPPNVARRQEIRENGVALLETLIGIQPDGTLAAEADRDYDRIVIVAHSLGTIVAYDILTHAFARVNTIVDKTISPFPQDARVALEGMIREGLRNPPQGASLRQWIGTFREAQAAARAELNATGNPWIVSDFVTLGSPLTHAEFLMVRDRARLSDAKRQRILPSCPPTLEYDGTTKTHHFTYRGPLSRLGQSNDPAAPRLPHHGAAFAYTRWTNLYSAHEWILWGDIISGKLADAFGLEKDGETVLHGIRDVAVMPALDAAGEPIAGDHRPFFSHTKYWTNFEPPSLSPHIQALREALRLKE